MDSKQIGEKLVGLCSKGKNIDAIESLYSKDVVSVEAMASPEVPAEMRGIDQIKGKNQWWYENNEVHSPKVEGPFPTGDRFAGKFPTDVPPRAGPRRAKPFQRDETRLYT